MSGGAATGSIEVLVTTDSSAGYELSIEAANSPAMQSQTATISDYAQLGQRPTLRFQLTQLTHTSVFQLKGATLHSDLDNGVACDQSGEQRPQPLLTGWRQRHHC